MIRLSSADIERFWKHVDVKGPSECWPWTGTILTTGYGQIAMTYGRYSGHRLSYTINKGPIPEHDSYHGMCVCHECDNRRCVNPSHLKLGLAYDNNQDKVRRDRCAKGEKSGVAKYTTGLVLKIREMFRQGVKQAQIARELGISKGGVAHVVKGRCWKHV